MKRLFALLLALMLLLSLFSCNDRPPTPDDGGTPDGKEEGTAPALEPNPATDFEYTVRRGGGGSISIIKYVGTSKSIVFPKTIDGLPVTVIGGYLLDDVPNSLIESVVIPDSVHTIVSMAFFGCTSLKSVDFGKGVLEIQDRAFESCTALEKIILPPNLETIGETAFYGCSSATEIFIPKTVKNWGYRNGVFAGCLALQKLTIEDGLEVFGGMGAFSQATSLKTLEIPASVKKIEHAVFHETTALESVVFLGDAPETDENLFGPNTEGSQTVSPTLVIYYDPAKDGWDETPLRQYRLVPIE